MNFGLPDHSPIPKEPFAGPVAVTQWEAVGREH